MEKKPPTSFFIPLLAIKDDMADGVDQNMSLATKMNLFYSKSENNFGIYCTDDEQSLQSTDDWLKESSENSPKLNGDDVITVTDSVIDRTNDDVTTGEIEEQQKEIEEKQMEIEEKQTEIEEQQTEIEEQQTEIEEQELEIQTRSQLSNLETCSSNVSRPSPTICKKVSLEFSLPSSSMEYDTRGLLIRNEPTLVESGTGFKVGGSCISECSSRTSSNQVIDGSTNSDSLDCISTISSSASINLQDKIDSKIQEGQNSGHIDFSDMRLPFLPSALLSIDMSMVNRLSLQDNQISCLSGPSLRQLTSISWLDLRFNKLKVIPSDIMFLKNLQVLLLQGNLIQKLPLELGYLPELKKLQFSENPIRFPPKNILKGGLEVIMKFLGRKSSKCSTSRTDLSSSSGSKNSIVSKRSVTKSISSVESSEKNITTLISQEQSINKGTQCENATSSTLGTDEGSQDPAVVQGDDCTSVNEDLDSFHLEPTEDKESSYESSEEYSDICQCLCPTSVLSLSRKNSSCSSSIFDTLEEPKRLCEKIKRELEIENVNSARRKSLHLVLQQSDSVEELRKSRCFSCQKTIHKKETPTDSVTEYSTIPVIQMALPISVIQMSEQNDISGKTKLLRKKKSINNKSSKIIPKQKLTTAKRVERQIKQDRIRKKRSDQAIVELRELQKLRSNLGLQSWRDDTKRRQQELYDNFEVRNWLPACVESPFAIDVSTLSPRLQNKVTPPFTKLNERQRKLSDIESDIKDCLRKLGKQERKSSEECIREEVSSNFGSEYSRKSYKKKQLQKINSSETTAVLNQLHSLRRQIQRLKLNAFI